MKNNDQYSFKFYNGLALMVAVHILIATTGFVFFLATFNFMNLIYLYLCLFTIFAHFIWYFLSKCFGWKTTLYFDNDKAWLTIRKTKYEWKYSEMMDCKIKSYQTSRPPILIIVITTKLDYKKLKFAHSKPREKIFMEKCPNEKVKALIKKAFKDYEER